MFIDIKNILDSFQGIIYFFGKFMYNVMILFLTNIVYCEN